MKKIAGKRQKAKQYVDSPDNVYGFEYKLHNAISLLERARKITPEDKQKIWQFVNLLKALRVSKGRIAKYILPLKLIRENLGVTFESASRKDIENFVGTWLYEQGYSLKYLAEVWWFEASGLENSKIEPSLTAILHLKLPNHE